MKKLQKGFTLIELMIVIAIIAILAAILIPNFLHARAESQTAACEGNEKQIATALEEYAVDHLATYPRTAHGEPRCSAARPTRTCPTRPHDPVTLGVYNLRRPGRQRQVQRHGGQSYEIDDNGAHDKTVQIANGTPLATHRSSIAPDRASQAPRKRNSQSSIEEAESVHLWPFRHVCLR